MSVGSFTYDHEIKIDSTTKGLTLVRDDKGAVMYSVVEEIPKHESPLKIPFTSWIGGHGQYKLGDDTIYFDGQSIDTTKDGRIILGPLINSVGITGPAALDAAPTCACWYSAISKLMVATTSQIYWYDGTYFVSKYTFTGETITDLKEHNGILYVALGSTTRYYYSSDGANYTQTDLTDGYAEKFLVAPNPAGTDNILWKFKKPNEVAGTTDGRTLTVSDITLDDCEEAWSDGSGGDVTCTANETYFQEGDYSAKMVVASTAGVELLAYKDLDATVDLSDMTHIKLWIRSSVALNSGDLHFNLDNTAGCGSPLEAIDISAVSANVWTEVTIAIATPANCTAIAAIGISQVVDKGAMDLWIDDVRATNSTGAGGVEWDSPPIYVGDTSNNITNLFLINDTILIGREDCLFEIDTDNGLHPMMDSLKVNRSTNNFKYVTEWQTAVYFSMGQGIGEITGLSKFEPMGPLTGVDDIGKTGTCVGMTSDKDWLYVVMDEGTNSIIYKGAEVRRENKLKWEWCPWVFVGTNACSFALVVQHSATDRRLWFGYGTNMAYVILSDNPTADSAARFAAAGWIRLSYIYGTNPYWDKMFQSIVTETGYCATGISVTPKYRKDAESSMTALTAAITSNGVVKTNLTTALSCKRIQFELDFATNDSTKTPEVTYFEARGIEKPETVRIHEAVYSLGTTPTRSVETLRTFLRGGRTSTSLIRFADLRYGDKTSDTSYSWVIVPPGFPQEIEVLHEKGRPPELALKMRWQEVSYTVS